MVKFYLNKLYRFIPLPVILVLLLQAQDALAQKRNITGTVVDTEGGRLPGVSIVEKGTTNGAVTDSEGSYMISVGDDAVLVVTFIGMKTQEVPVGNQTIIPITLEADIETLGEVVVIGYGTVERRDLTSSVSSVGSKQLKDIPINSAAQALAGRLAGVQVTATEGSPDAQVKIRVRGGGSISQDNSPIYIVDGIQVENALDVISPQDIESIDVLKDASATAIYGARGANGIVIITTKGGRQQRVTVSVNSMLGVRRLANKLDVWKPYDYVKYQYERSRGTTTGENNFLEQYGTFEDLELYKGVPFVDWQDEVFGRSAVMQTHNVAVTGGNEISQFNLSATSNEEEGVMLGSDFDRKLVTFRFDTKVSKILNVGFNVRYNYTLVNGAGTSSENSSSVNRLRHSIKYRPYVMPGQTIESYDADYALETIANGLSLINPVLLTDAEYKQSKRSVANINGHAALKFTDYLSFKSTLGFDVTNYATRVFNDTITSTSQSNGQGQPMASIDTRTINILNNSNVLSFSSKGMTNVFGNDHSFDALIGHEIYEKREYTNFQQNYYFPVGITPKLAFGSMNLGTPQPTSYTQDNTEKLLSFFGRVNYAFRDKYLVSLSYRADGSSKFAEGKRWGYFPGASVAWRISSEPFFEPFVSTVNDLKIRASYGASGNNRIDDFLYLSVFEPGGTSGLYAINNGQVIAFTPSALANNNLKWEAIVSQNFGLDIGVFNNRLQASVDVYQNTSTDLLLDRVVPATSGYASQIQNIGKTSNRGIEIQLSGTPLSTTDFSWNATLNMSFNKNKVESLGPDLDAYVISSGWSGGNTPADYTVVVGKSVGQIYGFVNQGYYTIDDFDYNADTETYTLREDVPSNVKLTSVTPQPGVIKFKDVNDDGEVTVDDRTIIGNTSPKVFGGFNNQFTYKNFDLSVFVNFQFGNDILNANKLEFTSGYTVNSNLLSEMDNRWTNVNSAGEVVTDPDALRELNRDASLWSPLTSASSFYVHSWAVEDGSFVRVNNITLGYSLPSTLLQRVGITKARFYGTLNNIAVFTNYSGYDPEVDTRRNSRITPGVDYSAYPKSKGYIFGVNLTF